MTRTVVPGRSRGSGASRRRMTSNCRSGPACSRDRSATPESAVMRAASATPGSASARTVAAWPTTSVVRSCSLTRAVISMSAVSDTSRIERPGATVSPGRNSGSDMPEKNTPPVASRFSLTSTRPEIGDRTTRLSMMPLARSALIRDRLRPSSTTASAASRVFRCDTTSCSVWVRRRFISSSVSARFFTSLAGSRRSGMRVSSSARRTR